MNVVGVAATGPIHEYRDEDVSRLLENNFVGNLRCIRKFVRGMLQRQWGNIINTSSIHSLETMPGNALYAATKGAVNASARAIALGYAKVVSASILYSAFEAAVFCPCLCSSARCCR